MRQRAAELARINGRRPGQVLDADMDEARRELTGAAGLVPTPTPAEQLTEDQREAVPASHERQAPKVLPADEQTVAEQLVEEGAEDAEQEHMSEGTRESQRRDR